MPFILGGGIVTAGGLAALALGTTVAGAGRELGLDVVDLGGRTVLPGKPLP